MIISFSGLDGAGKTTQIKMLLSFYQQLGYKVGSIFDLFPDIRYHSISDLKCAYFYLREYDAIHIRFRLNSDRNSILMSKVEQSVSPQKVDAIRAAIQGYFDYTNLYRIVLRPLLRDGKALFFDRYLYDELAYKTFYGCPEIFLRTLYINNVKKPDFSLYLRITPQVCIARNQTRPEETAIIYKSISKTAKLVERFDKIASQENMVVINGAANKEEILKQIISTLFTSGRFPANNV